MVLLIAFGLMNLLAMAAITTIVVVEKAHPWGVQVSRAVGVVAIAFAALVLVHPALAPGLYHSPTYLTSGTM